MSKKSTQDIPLTVINYVKRTLEPLVIDDIVTQSRFINDPYIVQNKPRSVLCTPIINQGEWIGLLYLENQLTAGVFTRDRLEIVQLLTAQAPILYYQTSWSRYRFRIVHQLPNHCRQAPRTVRVSVNTR